MCRYLPCCMNQFQEKGVTRRHACTPHPDFLWMSGYMVMEKGFFKLICLSIIFSFCPRCMAFWPRQRMLARMQVVDPSSWTSRFKIKYPLSKKWILLRLCSRKKHGVYIVTLSLCQLRSQLSITTTKGRVEWGRFLPLVEHVFICLLIFTTCLFYVNTSTEKGEKRGESRS